MLLRLPLLDLTPLPAPFYELAKDVEQSLITDPEKAREVAAKLHAATDTAQGLHRAYAELLLARTLLSTRQWQAALESFEKARKSFLALERAALVAHAVLGRVYILLGTGQYAEASAEAAELEAQLANGPVQAMEIRALALNAIAYAEYAQGRPVQAINHLKEALKLREQLSPIIIAACLCNLGISNIEQGNYREAIYWLMEAYRAHPDSNEDRQLELATLTNLAYAHYLAGDLSLATEITQKAYAAAGEWQSYKVRAYSALNLGTYNTELQQTGRARSYLQEALVLSQTQPELTADAVLRASILDSLGTLEHQDGNSESALELYTRAREIAQRDELPAVEALTQLNIGRMLGQLGRPEARAELERALELAVAACLFKEQFEAHTALAELTAAAADWRSAYRHQQELTRLKLHLLEGEHERQRKELRAELDLEQMRREGELSRERLKIEVAARERAEAETLERTQQLAQAQREVVLCLALAAEYRDSITGEHIKRVGTFAAHIALALGWSQADAELLMLASRLHDVGKIGIPDSILLKPGKLTEVEYVQMQAHTLIGSQILGQGNSALLKLAQTIALSHHERWNGEGYPYGLHGEAIPLAGRIVAVADVYDALIQRRPYKAAWTPEQAAAELSAQAGRHFDPALVEVALRILNDVHYSVDELKELGPPTVGPAAASLKRELALRTQELQEARKNAGELLQLALSDSLTGLHNRRALELDLEQRIYPGAVDFYMTSLDLDSLKEINDSQGHQYGDQLLRQFALCLRQSCAAGKTYRIGGDEFAVLWNLGVTEQDIVQVLRRLPQNLRVTGQPGISFSYGSACYNRDAATAGDLLRVSDARMYRMKVGRRGEETDSLWFKEDH